MNDETPRSYRGLEIYPLVYPHTPRSPGGTIHYDEGFDASVRISRPGKDAAAAASRIFRVPARVPFSGAGEARLASARYAERLIDGQIDGESIAI
ncbi:hypothetical protein BGLT_01709 [Caballeronia glathei]|jgi:hypothetical protein|uniref:Uncharacterized protein n=1 Tax=Caballeronia glathei TaxID=60547 RepID=A0A069PSA8_9BURK|nr:MULTISPECIES: hypothetical protein [Burkholderiaceae]KDR42764.1 hypothetical protein BG61_06370 [Caballeronia glathei]TCK37021.1 hypothetical protein B0G84_6056 [Paraburkholderia sp. BL8N3]CDY79016.1 hypothetical protein BGLT_01709 [Caballeronia glathei]